MLKERLKTFLLLSLVFFSMFLIRQVWMQSPYEKPSVFEEEEIRSTNYLFADMIKPYKYHLNFDEKSHTISHNDENTNLWTSTHSSLIEILSSDDINMETISNEDFSTYNDYRSIVFYFPEKFNTYILAHSLDIKKPNKITEKLPNIDSIYLYLGREEPYIIFSQEDKHLKVSNSNMNVRNIKDKLNKIEESKDYTYYYPMKDTLDIDNDIYIPYNMSKSMPIVYVENELNTDNIDEIRNVAEVFFGKDIDYIREIIENNGSIIYIYEQRVLKINRSGLLEYFKPLEEPVHERNLNISLNTVSEFLSNHIEVPEDLYLSNIKEIESKENLGYRLTFKYRIRGFPVIFKDDSVEDFIEIDVFNKYVRNYRRFIREDMNIKDYNVLDTRKMLSAHDIINMNYDLFEKDYIEDNDILVEGLDRSVLEDEILSAIEDISIAYLDPCEKEYREELIGVWLLKIGDRNYAFDIYEGNLELNRK